MKKIFLIAVAPGTLFLPYWYEKVGGGDVAIEAKQILAFDPPGVTSAIGGAMLMFFHHSVRMRKTSEGWKIVAFKPTFLEMRETRRR